MITLRELVVSHRDVAAITAEECHLIASVLAKAADSWVLRRLLPKACRDRALSFRMLAAALGKVPAGQTPSFAGQVRLLMRKGAKTAPREEWSQAELEGKHG